MGRSSWIIYAVDGFLIFKLVVVDGGDVIVVDDDQVYLFFFSYISSVPQVLPQIWFWNKKQTKKLLVFLLQKGFMKVSPSC